VAYPLYTSENDLVFSFSNPFLGSKASYGFDDNSLISLKINDGEEIEKYFVDYELNGDIVYFSYGGDEIFKAFSGNMNAISTVTYEITLKNSYGDSYSATTTGKIDCREKVVWTVDTLNQLKLYIDEYELKDFNFLHENHEIRI
jgi:hypothetical protein